MLDIRYFTNPLNNKQMKKFIARNAETGDKVFCKYEVLNTGILRVEYYLPKAGFSVIWDRKHNFCRFLDIRNSTDGRKSIVTYAIHPNYWSGFGFQGVHCTSTIFSAMDECLKNNINLHI